MTQETPYQLVVRKGPAVGQVIPLDLPVMTIGRDPISDVVLNDPEVSRQHVRLTLTEDGYTVQDLGSTNGTFVDGNRISGEPVVLQPGQKVSLGSGVDLVYDTGKSPEMTLVADLALPEEPEASPPPAEPPPAPAPARELPPEPVYTPPPEPAPAPAYTAVSPEEPQKKSNTPLIIAIVSILLLCCCCTFTLFMYQWGGDWLLQYFGLLP